MSIGVKGSGAWKDVNAVSVRVGGAWKAVSQAYVKVSGTWKELLLSAPVSISMTAAPAAASTSAGVVTFSSQSIGAAASDRWVYVAVTAETNLDLAGVTIGGVAASLVIWSERTTNPTPDTQAAIYRLLVPAGTTANIVVTLAGSASDNIGITVLRVVGGAGTIADTKKVNGTANITLAIPTNGGGIYVVAASGLARSWTNATQVSDFAVGSDGHGTAIRVDAAGSSVAVFHGANNINSSFAACAIG